jgi:hypothetical protein
MTSKELKKICDICGGSGQQSFFKGVSRFLLSTEECSACAGTGLQLETLSGEEGCRKAGRKGKRGTWTRKK